MADPDDLTLRAGYSGPDNLSPTEVDKRLTTHNIKKLADWLNEYLACLDTAGPDEPITPQSWQLLTWLDSKDPGGQTYRYAVVGGGSQRAPARPVQTNINFYEQVNELHQLAHLLAFGHSAWLDDYEQIQKRWAQELREQVWD